MGIQIDYSVNSGISIRNGKNGILIYIESDSNNPYWNLALEEFGVHAEFNGRNDLTIGGKKFSGNSQYARKGRILHHGCIMLDSNLDKVKNALRVKEAKFESKSVKSVRSRVTTINEQAPHRIAMEEFKEALKRQTAAQNELETYVLTDADRENIRKLQREKYETWEWNYGFYSSYSIRRDMKFENALVSVNMEVEKGVIQKIRLFGDFFGNRDIEELERGLAGLRLDGHLEEKLRDLHSEEYIYGVPTADLAGLLR